ncbi:hypothetical protein P3T22_002883 [Paraburkholderia sp. GAS348]
MDKEIDKDVTSEVCEQLLDAYLSVEKATKIIQEKCSRKEFECFRSEAGRVAGGLYLLLEPLWRAYPDLAPAGLEMTRRKKKARR